MDDEERLVVLLEARIKDLERNMAKASGTTERRFREMSMHSKGATRQMEQDAIRSTTRINQALATVSTRIGDYGKAFTSSFAIGAATVGVTGFIAATKAAIESTAELSRQSRMAGVDVEAFQELKFVAEQNKIGIDAMTDGLKEMNLRADEFIATGTGGGAEAFQRLGYSSEELAQKIKKPADLFVEIIGRMMQFERAAQIRIGDELFGGSAGERFVELVDQGAEGLKETIAAGRELGLVMDREMVQRAEEVDKKFNLITQTVGTKLKAAIVDAVSAWYGFIDSFEEFKNQQDATLKTRQIEIGQRRLELENKILEVQNNGALQDEKRVKAIAGYRIELDKLSAEDREITGIRNTRLTRPDANEPSPKIDTSAEYMRTYRDELAKTNRERQIATETEKILADAASKGASLTREQAVALAQESVARSERDAAAKKSASESERSAKATATERQKVAELIKDLETEISLVWASEAAKRASAASRQAGAAATDAERQKIIALNEALFQEEEARRRADEQMLFYRDLTRAGLDDLFSAVEQGKTFWQALGDVGVNSLKRIGDALINDVLDSIFKVNSAAGGSGGGFLSSLLGGLFGGTGGFAKLPAIGPVPSPRPFAKGGAFLQGLNGFSNQIVSKPTMFAFADGAGLMGEAGAEAIMPLTRDASGRLGVSALGGGENNSSSQSVHVVSDVRVSVDQNGNLQAFVERTSADATRQGIQAYDKQMPDRVQQINRNPRRR
ncbi:tail tape measure protein [Rhizobium sp. BR 250]